MASFPPVQSVVRAMQLLQALNTRPVSTIDVLHKQTGIPKPSLVRLLQTFAEIGVVRHAPQHGAYLLTSRVCSLASGYHGEPKVVEASAPLLDDLTKRIKWPAALAMYEDNAVFVRYSTIPISPLALLHSTIDMRLSLVSRALGRAYLAFCDNDEQDFLLTALQSSKYPEDHCAQDADSIRRVLDEVRRDGYAKRDPGVRPVSHTIAVPVLYANRVQASIGITFFASTLSVPQAVERYLDDLLDTADRIAAALSQMQPSSSPSRRDSRSAAASTPRVLRDRSAGEPAGRAVALAEHEPLC
ncbi:DNA-binding transcriptional regulator [Paraburkholderia caballeronis]|uniref:Transcriptional regulator, IclR family n=1 Tax=Paraburkholderia caballeronis TaxID=416943 RepID=A0A1H7JC37_9BURK|nr:DNA-binding transcriptional regulator [Paraburkholderia caballeronis]PXW27506.1 IclR family transcriptional regulator [Paraburkholderia caballeronis]PXX02980.1 IclR family transcriptional regulator [Paraburkholderia caballeronis]RAK03705.1 IclR family transcriptional regulator [Paraburkholderia caballeronis]SEC24691.1 transcriptional regulator, IclR family [Paraburkholderia caballeronis]SEK71487.1 transcriptional regulator, IclR family [Paraburkholderia caballeronis]